MKSFNFLHAKTLAEAARAATPVADSMLSPTDAVSLVKAGGIDVLDLCQEGLLAPNSMTSLRDVAELRGVAARPDGGLRIGAMTTLADVAGHAEVAKLYPALAAAAGDSASPQIRNVATLGGNLLQRPRCWYFRAAEFRCLRKGGGHCFAISGENIYHAIFDNRSCAIVHPSTSATALVALGAQLELVDADNAVRVVPLEDFLIGAEKDVQRENDLRPNEILKSILLPPSAGLRMAHRKLAQKESFDWPLADVAVVLDLDAAGLCRRAAIVMGAAAPTPHRAGAAEAVLAGKRIDEANAREAGRAAVAGATPLSGNAYKIPMFETLVRRTLLQAAGLG